MPIYTYKCHDCNDEFLSFKEDSSSCTQCDSKETERIFGMINVKKTKSGTKSGDSQPGKVVIDFIKEAKEEIKKEKETMSREYEAC